MNCQGRKGGRTNKELAITSGRTTLAIAAAVAATVVAATAASAQLIATDHFSIAGGYTASQLSGSTPQTPTVPGFSGAWQNNVGAAGVAQWVVQAAGLDSTVPTYESPDKARFTTLSTDLVRRVWRTLDTYTPSNTYYMAFHTQVSYANTTAGAFVGLGFTNNMSDAQFKGDSDGLGGLLIGMKSKGPNTSAATADFVVRHRGLKSDSTIGTKDDVLDTGVGSGSLRYTIVKLEVNVDPGNPNGDDRISVWLNPTNTLSELSSGSPLVFNSFAMTSNADITQLSLAARFWNNVGNFDEPRFASSWGGASGFAETKWNVTGGGDWDTGGNWTGGVPTGLAANFLSNSADATITTVASQTTGLINFDSSHKYTITGQPITLDVATGLTAITVVSGNHQIDAPVNLNDSLTLNVVSGSGSVKLAALGNASTLTVQKLGLGTAEVNAVRANKLIVGAGTLKISANGTDSGTSVVGAGGLLGSNAGGPLLGKLDLTNNKLVVTGGTLGTFDGGTLKYSGITGEVQNGRNGGAWNGAGIITSMTDAIGDSPLTTIAIAKADDIGKVGLTFGGITVATNDILIGYTYAGDMNLDGAINGDDYARIDNGFSGVLSGYENGDLNYSGNIDADDYFLIDRNYSHQGSPFAAAPLPSGVNAVPEPGSLTLLGCGAALLLRRKRR